MIDPPTAWSSQSSFELCICTSTIPKCWRLPGIASYVLIGPFTDAQDQEGYIERDTGPGASLVVAQAKCSRRFSLHSPARYSSPVKSWKICARPERAINLSLSLVSSHLKYSGPSHSNEGILYQNIALIPRRCEPGPSIVGEMLLVSNHVGCHEETFRISVR